MTAWLIDWAGPFAAIVFIVLLVWLWSDIRRLPYRRYEKPMQGTNGLYLPERWKPKE